MSEKMEQLLFFFFFFLRQSTRNDNKMQCSYFTLRHVINARIYLIVLINVFITTMVPKTRIMLGSW